MPLLHTRARRIHAAALLSLLLVPLSHSRDEFERARLAAPR